MATDCSLDDEAGGEVGRHLYFYCVRYVCYNLTQRTPKPKSGRPLQVCACTMLCTMG